MTDNTAHKSERLYDDAEVVSSCLNGDTDAFGHIVSKYEKDIFNLAFRMSGSYDEACEITQDVFISAYRNLRGFRRESKFYTWLYAIALNVTKTRLKKMKRLRFREVFSFGRSGRDDDHGYAEPASDNPSPLQMLESAQIRERIQDCISKLYELFREVIILHDIRGLSYEDIGRIIDKPQGTVKSRLFRARKGIKDCLQKSYGGEIPNEL